MIPLGNAHNLELNIKKYEKVFRELWDSHTMKDICSILGISYEKARVIRDRLGIEPKPHGVGWRKPRLEKTCATCEQHFYVCPYYTAAKYCSKMCSNKGREITWTTGWREAKMAYSEKHRKRENF